MKVQKMVKETEQTLLEFPCRFPVKAMGRQTETFEATVIRIVSGHADFWDDQSVKINPSSAGKFVSVTITVRATSQQQLDAIYQELTDCEEVLMAI